MNADSRELLLDRERELENINDLVAGVGEGRSGLLVIEGGFGEGKTTLLNHLVSTARQGDNLVLFASGSKRPEHRAFGTLRELFEPVEVDVPVPSEPEGDAELWTHRDASGSPTETKTLEEVFADLYHQTRLITERNPLIIVIDDLHRADRESLSWLVYLARRSAGSALLLAVAVTRGESATDTGLVEDLRDTVTCVSMYLEPLSVDAVRELVRSHCRTPVDDAFVAACLDLTNGTAALVRELCRALSTNKLTPSVEAVADLAELPVPRIAEYVGNRINRVCPHALNVAHVIAVLGSDANMGLVAALSSLEESVTIDVVLSMTQLGLLSSTASFVHPIARTALYHSLPALERRGLHHRAGRQLAQRDGRDPRRVASHLLAMGATTDPQAVDLLCRTADELAEAGEAELSVACLRRAMRGSISPAHRARLALRLGIALGLHDVGDSIRHLRHARTVIASADERLTISWHLATALAMQGNLTVAIDVLSDQIAVDDRRDGDLVAYRALLSMLSESSDVEDPAPPAFGPGRRVVTATRLAWTGRQQTRAVALANQFLLSGEMAAVNAVTFSFALLVLLYADRLELVERHLADAQQQNRPLPATEIATLRCQAALRRGDLKTAEILARSIVQSVEDGQLAPITFHHIGTLIDVLLARGEHEEAAEVLSAAGLLYQLPSEWRFHHLLTSRGRLRVARGDTRAGLHDLLTAGSRMVSMGVVNPAVNLWRTDAALALVKLGYGTQAQTIADRQVTLAREWGAIRSLGQSLHTQALIETDPDLALRLMQDGVDVLNDSVFELDLGRALVDLGCAQAGAGLQQEARDSLRHGLDLAHRCDAAKLAEQAHAELVKSGARPRRRAQSGRNALTPTEERIAQMVVDGKTNREISQELFVSLRTIELHLTNIYRKFRIVGRSGLVAVMDDQPETQVASMASR